MDSFETDLAALTRRFPPPVAALFLDLVRLVRELRPDFAARVQPGWGSVNFRHRRAGFVCAVFADPKREKAQLIFQHGRLLQSPLLTDNGKVTQVRWIDHVGGKLPVDDIAILLAEAVALRE